MRLKKRKAEEKGKSRVKRREAGGITKEKRKRQNGKKRGRAKKRGREKKEKRKSKKENKKRKSEEKRN